MLKILVFIVILIIFSIVFMPVVVKKFTVWDAADPSDDQTGVSKTLLTLTPNVTSANVNQTMDIEMGGKIIDVRTEKEYNQGHIKGAINIPEETLYERIPEMYADRNTLIYLYCDTGYRGAAGTRLLRSMGYDRAFNIESGIKGWEKTGFRLVRPNPAYF